MATHTDKAIEQIIKDLQKNKQELTNEIDLIDRVIATLESRNERLAEEFGEPDPKTKPRKQVGSILYTLSTILQDAGMSGKTATELVDALHARGVEHATLQNVRQVLARYANAGKKFEPNSNRSVWYAKGCGKENADVT